MGNTFKMNFFSRVATNCSESVRNTLDNDPHLVDSTDYLSRPSLFYPIAFQSVRMFELLLRYRPDISITDDFGLTVVDYARHYDHVCGSRYVQRLAEYDPDFLRSRYDIDVGEKDPDKIREVRARMRRVWSEVVRHPRFVIHRFDTSDEDDTDGDEQNDG